MLPPGLCVKCKGRLFCGRPGCIILERFSARSSAISKIQSKEFSGSSPPGIFISWRNYPDVSIAPLSPPEILPLEQASLLDSPERWLKLPEERIISMRESLVMASRRISVSQASNPDYKTAEIQEAAMASSPVVVDITLDKVPVQKISFDSHSAPMGPSATLRKFSLSENPKIPQKVDYLTADIDAKAKDAVMELYNSGFEVSYLHKILSAGLLGVKKQRRFVPTRWAITAVDTTISEILMGRMRAFQQISEVRLFHSYELGNNFWVLLFPAEWQFEQLEAWQPGSSWALQETAPTILSDYEPYSGRKDYADEVTGAYYSARLAVCEYLEKEQRQAACIVFREISPSYSIPLGVWQVRENVRNALRAKPLVFPELKIALSYLNKKLSIPMRYYEKKSALIDAAKHQRKLAEWC